MDVYILKNTGVACADVLRFHYKTKARITFCRSIWDRSVMRR